MHCSFGEMHYLHALSFRKVIKSISKNFKVQYVKTINCPIDYENDRFFGLIISICSLMCITYSMPKYYYQITWHGKSVTLRLND